MAGAHIRQINKSKEKMEELKLIMPRIKTFPHTLKEHKILLNRESKKTSNEFELYLLHGILKIFRNWS